MTSIAPQLKDLRNRTQPKLSSRAVADALGIPGSSYAAYEDSKKFKKPILPLDLAKKLASLFEPHGIPRAETLALAGLTGEFASTEPGLLPSDHAPTISASSGETVGITSLDLSLSFGPGTPIEDFVESEPVEFDIGLLRSITRSPYHRLRIVRGIGDSMEPKFYTGDRILVDTTERQLGRLDAYYWITLWGAHGLKRLRPVGPQRVMVISENPGHDPIEVDASELTIEGRAIWFARDL